MEKTIVFFNQWTRRPQRTPQEFHEPTCTVPNQSMTVAQIIAKYSRMGVIPAVKSTLEGGRFLQRLGQNWDGDNQATEPDFDPLDNGQELLEEAALRQKAPQESTEPAEAARVAGPGAAADVAGSESGEGGT